MQQHPEAELIAFARGELAGRAHDRVARHLDACAECRAARDDFRLILQRWRQSIPEPPALHAARYRAAVRQRLEAHQARASARAWWRWPVPLALSAGLAGILLFLAVHGTLAPADGPAVAVLDEAAGAPTLELLRNYALVERLDLLEDFDILRSLASPARRES
jgi:anti-sigma factor RsiW